MFKLFIGDFDVTRVVGDVSWSDSIDTLGTQLTFTLGYGTDVIWKGWEIALEGRIVTLFYNNTIVFTGICVAIDRDGATPRKVTAFDYAFYLNKSDTIIQFKKIPASQALKKLLDKAKVQSSIVNITHQITHTYRTNPAEILKDILSQATAATGIKYFFEMRGKVLHIFTAISMGREYTNLDVISPKRSTSIEEMRNSILVVSNKEDSVKVEASAQDAKSISGYGLLQKVHEIDENEVAKAKNVANQQLKALNKVGETASLRLRGDINLRAARIIQVKEPVTGLIGSRLITNCANVIESGNHFVDLTLEVM
ncbi:MAG: hypothetical protein RR595_05790 [Lysinibacillus sp.]